MNATVTAKTLAISGVIACGLGVLGASADAATFIDVNFDNVPAQTYTVGPDDALVADPTMVQAWDAAGGMSKMTDAYGKHWGSGVRVVGPYGVTDPTVPAFGGFASNSLRGYYHNSDAGPVRLGTTAGNSFTGTTTGQYEFTFDISLPDVTTAYATKPAVYLLGSNGTQTYQELNGTVNLAGAALLSVSISGGNITANGGNGTLALVTGATITTPYSIKALVDMDNNNVQFSVNNGPVLGTLTQLQAKDGHGIMGMGVDMGRNPSGEAATSYYDNFKLSSPVPEPTGMVFLGLSSLAFLRRKRKA